MPASASALICPKCFRPVHGSDEFCLGCGVRRAVVGWAADPFIGRVIDGKYRIDARLGAGGMGAVFQATHSFDGADLGKVVVKFLLDEHAEDPDRRARFLREARAARELRSPHVVKVFDFGATEDGTPYLVMEYIEGRSLFRVMDQTGLLPVRRALDIAMQVAEAMVECHNKGILHRDLKPDNLLLVDSRAGDFVKIVDFGVARMPAAQTGVGGSISQVSSLVIGTPRYMAPEQILGKPIDGRIDIFALGVILYEMMCGMCPIPLKTGDNEMAYVALNVTDPPRKVSDVLVGVPPALDALVDRMMAKAPGERPASMAAVLSALERLAALPEIQNTGSSQTVVTGPDAVAELLRPRGKDPGKTGGRARRGLTVTLTRLAGRRRYLVPALVGAVIGLLLLVAWLLQVDLADRQSGQAGQGGEPGAVRRGEPHREGGGEAGRQPGAVPAAERAGAPDLGSHQPPVATVAPGAPDADGGVAPELHESRDLHDVRSGPTEVRHHHHHRRSAAEPQAAP